MDKKSSANYVAKELSNIWKNANHDPKDVHRAGKQVVELYEVYLNLKRKRDVNTYIQRNKRLKFPAEIEIDIFDMNKNYSKTHKNKNNDNQNNQIGAPCTTGNIRAANQIAGSSNQILPVIYDPDQLINNNETAETRGRYLLREIQQEEFTENGSDICDVDNNEEEEIIEFEPDENVCEVYDRAKVSNEMGSLLLTYLSYVKNNLFVCCMRQIT